MRRLHENGFSIMENLVALGLVTIVVSGIIGGLVAYRKMSQSIMVMSSTDKEVFEIGENIRNNIDLFQVNYNFTPKDKEDALKIEKLPMAWDVGVSTPVEKCEHCGGRYGFIIQPYEEFRGLYLVTLRMTYRTWPEPYREYQFVVSAK